MGHIPINHFQRDYVNSEVKHLSTERPPYFLSCVPFDFRYQVPVHFDHDYL